MPPIDQSLIALLEERKELFRKNADDFDRGVQAGLLEAISLIRKHAPSEMLDIIPPKQLYSDVYSDIFDFIKAHNDTAKSIEYRAERLNAAIMAHVNHFWPKAIMRELVAHPASEWHEDIGPVLWWTSPVTEPAYCGTPLDDDFPSYMKHWTPLQVPTTCIEAGSANG